MLGLVLFAEFSIPEVQQRLNVRKYLNVSLSKLVDCVGTLLP